MPPVCGWVVFGRDCSQKARALPRPRHCQPGMSPQNSAQAPVCEGLPGMSTQVIHFKSPIGCSQCYPYYVVIFATYLEPFFCCRTTRNRQMQTDNTICLGECNSPTELLIPARSNTARESMREVRGTTSSHHLFSEKRLKLRIPKEWLGSRNKIRFLHQVCKCRTSPAVSARSCSAAMHKNHTVLLPKSSSLQKTTECQTVFIVHN